MCRNIKKLRYPDRSPTDEELELAALQYVRKITGYRSPSQANEAVFNTAIAEIAGTTRRLFDNLVTKPSKNAGSARYDAA